MGDFDEWVAKYMGYVDRAISMVPYKRLAIFKEFFFNPVETIRKDDVGIGQRLKDMYVLNSVSLALSILAMLPLMLVSALFNPAAGMIYLMIFAAEYAFLLALGPIIGFLYTLLELLVAKLLGGTGDMRSRCQWRPYRSPGLARFRSCHCARSASRCRYRWLPAWHGFTPIT
jgi:hypothetical protein